MVACAADRGCCLPQNGRPMRAVRHILHSATLSANDAVNVAFGAGGTSAAKLRLTARRGRDRRSVSILYINTDWRAAAKATVRHTGRDSRPEIADSRPQADAAVRLGSQQLEQAAHRPPRVRVASESIPICCPSRRGAPGLDPKNPHRKNDKILFMLSIYSHFSACHGRANAILPR